MSCEPTGHRWRVLGQLAAQRSMPFVCVQPVVTSWSRRTEDLTSDKTDEKDVVLIARLTAQLRCYIPEPVDETWGRLRHLGTRREQLITEAGSQVQQMRDLLECVWPAVLDAAVPFGHLDRGAVGGRRPGRRGLRPHPAAGARPVRAGGLAGDCPPRRAEALPADRARGVRRARRSGRGDRAPARRA